MSHVPDDIFAHNVVGPGRALLPETTSSIVDVRAPISGNVTAALPHAFSIESGNYSALVHLGVDTVNLRGDGFTVHVRAGDYVTQGDVLVTWDVAVAQQHGYSLVCPIVLVQAQEDHVTWVVDEGDVVAADEIIMHWSVPTETAVHTHETVPAPL